eukprot:Em0001g2272a
MTVSHQASVPTVASVNVAEKIHRQLLSTPFKAMHTTAVGKTVSGWFCKGSSTSRQFLKPREYITAAMTDKVTIVKDSWKETMYELCWILDLPFRTYDKGSVPIVSGQMPQLQTADGHKLTVMGTVKAHLQLEQFSTEHGFLVTNSLITPVILGIDFLSKHKVRLDYRTDPQVFERLANAGLTLRGSKCQLGLDKVHYLGHVQPIIASYAFHNPSYQFQASKMTNTCAGTVTVTLEDVVQEQGKDEVLNEPTALKANHDIISSGHQGVEKTLQRLKRTAYWIGMANDTELYCRSCIVCQRSKLPMPTPVPMTNIPIGHPWQMLAVDVLQVPTAEYIAGILIDLFSRFGIPGILHSDQAAGKVDPKWDGGWVAKKVHSPVTLQIEHRKSLRSRVVHINRIRRCIFILREKESTLSREVEWEPASIELFSVPADSTPQPEIVLEVPPAVLPPEGQEVPPTLYQGQRRYPQRDRRPPDFTKSNFKLEDSLKYSGTNVM